MELGMVSKDKFRILRRFYRNNDFENLLNDDLGIYFLKMRSISRTRLLRELALDLGIDVSDISGKGDQLFEYIFIQEIPEKILDDFILRIYEQEREERRKSEDYLYSQLYKLKVFDWGGFYQNAVEQTIVNNYVKKVQNYDDLCNLIENDINPRLRGYILCSWYNHWSSILIEDMFKDHRNVLPAVGLIKKVDFFWKNFPFDLKVTYFPDGYMQLKRSEMGLSSELSILKKYAKSHDIAYDRNSSNNAIFTELLTRISEDPTKEAKNFISEFHEIRRLIITETIKNPSGLIRWFYEQQGIRRFDAANRFFLVLIDLENLEDSWKLKRNKKLLQKHITNFLDNSKNVNFEKLKLTFNWEGKDYTTYAAILFVFKE